MDAPVREPHRRTLGRLRHLIRRYLRPSSDEVGQPYTPRGCGSPGFWYRVGGG